jgi:hypothetical protein
MRPELRPKSQTKTFGAFFMKYGYEQKSGSFQFVFSDQEKCV